MDYIDIFNPHIQRELLDTIGSLRTVITLWQSVELEEDQRKVMNVGSIKVNLFEEQIEFIPKKNQYLFNSQLPVYFYTKHRNCIFKSSLIFNSNFKVICRWPRSFMLENERRSTRDFPLKNSHLTFNLKVNNSLYKEFTKPIIDHSECGISIRIPVVEVNNYGTDAPIRCEISGEPKKGHVRYISALLGRMNRGFYRVGISFDQ